MAKLEAELDEAGLLVTPSNPTPRAFTFSDIGKLHYLDHVIKVHHILTTAVTSLVAVASCLGMCDANLATCPFHHGWAWVYSHTRSPATDGILMARVHHCHYYKYNHSHAPLSSVCLGLVSQPH